MSDYTYKSQDVNYLGFLEAQLRDLHGLDTLAYELIQNADDVRAAVARSPATWLSFDVTDDALIIENDGVFRELDFERLQSIASGSKRAEAGTTGAFGLGFIAVYQVTDYPEIFSNDVHWVIRPDAAPQRRIEERNVETSGTRFYLPWAFDGASVVRRTLRIEAIRPDQLDGLAETIAAAIGLAALFLKQLQVLEVRRNGHLVRRIERQMAGDRSLLLKEEDGRTATWLLFTGEFSGEADRLREVYAWQIEDKRHSEVRIAVPANFIGATGRLFAVLPTDDTTPLPFHINADFFPTSDRRRIHFDDGYQAFWNQTAIECAAGILAENIDALRQQLEPVDFWLLLQKVLETNQLAGQNGLPDVFKAFWQALAPVLANNPVIVTSTGNWSQPADVRLVERHTAIPLLEALGIAVVHPQLSPFYALMRRAEIGVPPLSVHDVSRAHKKLGLSPETPLEGAPTFLRSLEAWRELWLLIDDLLSDMPPHEQHKIVMQELGDCVLLLTDKMTLTRLNRAYRGNFETKALFPQVSWLNDAIVGETFPGRFVQNFGVRQAVDHISALDQWQLEEAWRMGQLDIPDLFRWFESNQIEIFADDPALQKQILALPLCPVAGELRPLAHLYIPGGFEDPLNLAGFVDLQAVGGRPQFLRDLGLQELDFETYVHEHIPRVLAQNPDLPSDASHRLLQLLANRLGEIRDDGELREQLSELPLIPCMDGSFRAARETYATREAAALIGQRTHVAEPAGSQALQALYKWLGVRRQPSADDLVQELLRIAADSKAARTPLDESALNVVLQIWQRLDNLFAQQQLSAASMAQLQDNQTLPDLARRMAEPGMLFFVDQVELANRFSDSGIDKHLLMAEQEMLQVMAAAGVRLLSNAVQPEVVDQTEALIDPHIQERIDRRRSLFERLLNAEDQPMQDVEWSGYLDGLQVLSVPHLQIRYRLQIGRESYETAPQTEAARLISSDHTLYVNSDEQPLPWAAIARELVTVIKASGNVASLALGAKEVLAADSYASASQILDELGYP